MQHFQPRANRAELTMRNAHYLRGAALVLKLKADDDDNNNNNNNHDDDDDEGKSIHLWEGRDFITTSQHGFSSSGVKLSAGLVFKDGRL